MKVSAIPKVLDYLRNLVPILYEKDYSVLRNRRKNTLTTLLMIFLTTCQKNNTNQLPRITTGTEKICTMPCLERISAQRGMLFLQSMKTKAKQYT